MSRKSALQHLIEVKSALAEKYLRLARMRRSKGARQRLLRHAERFRSQAKNAAREAAEA